MVSPTVCPFFVTKMYLSCTLDVTLGWYNCYKEKESRLKGKGMLYGSHRISDRFKEILRGSGKSTLLNMLGGLDVPSEGSVRIGNQELSKLSAEQATIFRRKQTGFIFQNYNLVPVLTVWENIIFPISLDSRKPDEKFIMAIARALSKKPSIILADEPTGNLDSGTSDDVVSLLKMTRRQFHQTIVMITHNPEIAACADRVIRIEDGRLAYVSANICD